MNDDPTVRPKRGGRSAKAKGAGFEREVVALLQERGLAAEKVPLSGAVKGGSFDRDVTCQVRGIDRPIECKRRKRRFGEIAGWLGGNFALVIRDDRSKPMVVMSLDAFAELAGGTGPVALDLK